MAYVYILFSKKWNRYYVGSTPDVERRLNEHNSGMTPSTRHGRPWLCVFFHRTQTLIEARRIEYKIKSWKDRRLIERIVNEQMLKIG